MCSPDSQIHHLINMSNQTYKSVNDDERAGDIYADVELVNIFQQGLRLLLKEISTFQDLVGDFNLNKKPFFEEKKRLSHMIAWNSKELASSNGAPIFLCGLSYGTLRWLKAAMAMVIMQLEEEKQNILNSNSNVPREVIKPIDEKISLIKEDAEQGIFKDLRPASLFFDICDFRSATKSITLSNVKRTGMALSEESKEIGSRFSRYSKTGDESLIIDIPKDKLKLALIQYSSDKRFPHYAAMEMRLKELDSMAKPVSRPNPVNGWAKIFKEYGVTKSAFGKRIDFVKDPFKREILFRDVEHAYRLADGGFFKSAVILAGGVIEELLRLYLESKAISSSKKDFDGYIKECENKKLLKAAISRLSDSVRHFRNYVHLEKETSVRHTLSKANAKGSVASIFVIVNDFT